MSFEKIVESYILIGLAGGFAFVACIGFDIVVMLYKVLYILAAKLHVWSRDRSMNKITQAVFSYECKVNSVRGAVALVAKLYPGRGVEIDGKEVYKPI